MANRGLGVPDYERSDFRNCDRAFFNCLNKLGGGAMKFLMVYKERPNTIDVFSVQTLDANILSAISTLINYYWRLPDTLHGYYCCSIDVDKIVKNEQGKVMRFDGDHRYALCDKFEIVKCKNS